MGNPCDGRKIGGMSESYEVVAKALNRHARTLLELAGELRSAVGEAGGVRITGNAYGQTAARFASAANDMASEGAETLRAGVEAIEETATALRATATAYETQDAAGIERLTTVGGGLA